jgi:hypothetical protein
MAKAATATPSFGSILDRAPSEIEKPKPLPQGSYITLLVGQPRFDKSTKKQTEYAEFTHKILSSGEDVDDDDLKSYLAGGKKLTDVLMKNTYYLTEGATWRLKDFLGHCGIDVDALDSLREGVEETPGKQVGIFINHEASQDGTSVFARIGKTFEVE